MKIKDKMDRIAKKCGYDYARRIGIYHGYEVWDFDTNKYAVMGYPVFALVKDKKVWTIRFGHKYHQRIWDFVNKKLDEMGVPE